MSGSIVLLNLAGAVALLLFATRMVRTGVERAYGDLLRHRLRGILKNPFLAVGAGGVLAICLQSATAVALIVGAFVGSGIVGARQGCWQRSVPMSVPPSSPNFCRSTSAS